MSNLTIPIRGNKLSMNVEVRGHLFTRQSEFQRIDIVDTLCFGRMLLLDNHIQLAELDEHAYHESLVHIPMLSLNQPKRALVVGGGDGGVVREILRHNSIRHVDMVEIDRAVIDACTDFLPFLNGGAFDDTRLKIHVADAFEFVKGGLESYDLIVMDSTDVYEEEDGGLSEQLWTGEFYSAIHSLLSPEGIVVTQADNPVFCRYSLDSILATYRQAFAAAGSYWGLVPSFGGYSAFVWGSKGREVSFDWPGSLPAMGQGMPHEFGYLNAGTLAMAEGEVPFRGEFESC
ncbi:MAG: hypothetical protein ABL949_08285 [Fimbriimonadaceae bacterium]